MRIALTYFSSLLLIVGSHFSNAQDNRTSKNVDEIVRGYIEKADALWHQNTLLAIEYADSAFARKDQLTDSKLIAEVQANKGVAVYMQGNYVNAAGLYLEAYNLAVIKNVDPTAYFGYYLTALTRLGESSKVLSIVDSIQALDSPIDPFSLKLKKISALLDLGDTRNLANEFSELNNLKYDSSYSLSVLNYKGKYLKLLNQYRNSREAFEELLEANIQLADSMEIANSLLEISFIDMAEGMYDSASIRLNESQRIYSQTGYQLGVAKTHSAYGQMYAELGQNGLSVENYFKALNIYESLSTKSELAETYHELAWMYFEQDPDQSLELLSRALTLSQELSNKRIEGKVYNYLGVLYSQLNDFDNALLAYKKSAYLNGQLDLKRRLSSVEFNIGALYESQGRFSEALDYYLKTYPIELGLGNELGAGVNEYALGHLYILTNQFSLAKEYLFRAKKRLELIDAKADLIYCFEYISLYYQRINDPVKALEFYKEFHRLKEDVYSRQRESRLEELEVRYLLNSKEQEIELLNLQNKTKQQDLMLQEKTISNRKVFIALVSVGVLCFAILFIFTYRLLKIRNATNKELKSLNFQISEKVEEIATQSEELQEANEEIASLNDGLERQVEIRTEELVKAHKELDTFFYHAAHDFRQPLTSFYGLVNLADQNVSDPDSKELFTKIFETTASMERMVNKLIEISVLGSENMEWTVVSLNDLVSSSIAKFQTLIDEKKIELLNEVKGTTILTSRDILDIVLSNVIENSLVFTSRNEKPWTKIIVQETETEVVIVISDNGQGIKKELQSKVYDMYFRGNIDSLGNGLGLYVAKKAVEKIRGTLSFESTYHKGSTFKITISKVLS